ncbi:hypothetical protein DW352_05250 [Pseudolabrys taiwanensis]|uniref:Uncharacterized protein n=2 Tax=Pseudolabrys taiwanensis TaxID=331696 RepID=A0A345ZSS9_9HYPH|nr:hypothetical protein DW352_05250 [Pseudolabrys taiwanensis]
MNYINSLSLDDLRRELAWEIDLRHALIKTFRDLPENPEPLALRALCELASWDRDHELGKKIQREHGLAAVPPKSEYEDAAGLWARIRPVLASPAALWNGKPL